MTVNQESAVRRRHIPRDGTAEFVTTMGTEMFDCRSAGWLDPLAPPAKTEAPGGVSLGDAILDTLRRVRESRLCSNPSYRLSALVGVLTYIAYGSLNEAWSNWALIGVSVYMYLSIPLYSKLSNWVERTAAGRTGLGTGGRVARYALQLLINLALLWVFIEGRVVSLTGLDPIGGFFATAAWITVVSQGGQYLANGLAMKGIGTADRNVVLAVSISASVNALAVSGVAWIQPIYVAVSLGIGAAIFGLGLLADAKNLFARNRVPTPQE